MIDSSSPNHLTTKERRGPHHLPSGGSTGAEQTTGDFGVDRWQREGPVQCRILTFGDGTFQHDVDGFEALCLPVHNWNGDEINVVAWQEAEPQQWWLWKHVATALGERAIWQSGLNREHFRLVATPAEWVGADPMTACILDWSADPRRILCEAYSIEAPPELAKRLRANVAAQCWLPIAELK